MPNIAHKLDLPMTILKVDAFRVRCNITTGVHINEHRMNTIHEFFLSVLPMYEIVEVPSYVIYMPVAVQAIQHL